MDVAAATIFRISWEAWRELGAEFDPDAARPSDRIHGGDLFTPAALTAKAIEQIRSLTEQALFHQYQK